MSGYRKLGRKTAHRKTMLRNLVTDLFREERISTTEHRAKEARKKAEKIITLAKKTLFMQEDKYCRIYMMKMLFINCLMKLLRSTKTVTVVIQEY